MISSWMMKFLIIFYIGLSLACAIEGRWWLVLYWVSATGITISILGGMR